MSINVINPGALTTVQDEGRIGYRQFGIPRCGVMDHNSYILANQLLHNDLSCAVLECTLFGGIYRFDADTHIALTGADMQPTINSIPVSMNSAITVKAGDLLSLGYAVSGCRTYLGVSGGIDVPSVMGSRSTFMKCSLGGFKGRALQAGDVIPVKSVKINSTGPSEPALLHDDSQPDRAAESTKNVQALSAAAYSDQITVRVILGPQDHYFTENGIETFFTGTYKMSEQSDRMGCRLDGPVIESINGCDIISDGTVPGSIQVTSAGLPIILMADAQTTGGYAKIGTVCSYDLPLLAQCKPGGTVRFKRISIDTQGGIHE